MSSALRLAIRSIWRSDRVLFGAVLLAGMANVAISGIQVSAFADLIEHTSQGGNGESQRAIGYITIFVVSEVVGAIIWKYLAERQELGILRLSADTSREVLSYIAEVEPVEFEDPTFLDAMERIRQGLGSRPAQLIRGATDYILGLGSSIGALAALARINPVVAGAIAAALLLPVLADLSTARADNTIFNINLQRTRRAGYLTGIGISRRAIAENRIFNFIDLLIDEVGDLYQSIIGVHWRLRRKALIRQSLGLVAMGFVVALVFTLSRSLADFALILFGYQRMQIAFGTAGQGASEAASSLPFLTAASAVLSREANPVGPGEVNPRARTTSETERVSGSPLRLSASNLSFTYRGQAVAAVRDFDFDFASNCTYLLRGRNGSGKSTLLSVVGGLFPSDTGTISLNDVALHPSSLRQFCSLQPQRFFQFELDAGVVSKGVGSSGDDWEIWADCFNLEEIFAGLKDGPATVLGRSFEGSQDISLGQWQRLVLARAFAKSCPILLLDEPTSFLDRRNVDGLHRALTLVRDRIIIISSHDPDLRDVAHVVLTLEAGQLVDSENGHRTHRPTSSRTA